MFSTLVPNSILYVLDFSGSPKVLTGTIEHVTLPRPKYESFNPNMEMTVDIVATINGERREFRRVPNGSVADFGEQGFILAESKDLPTSYVNNMLQNSRNILASREKHEKTVALCEEALQELNPQLKSDREKDLALRTMQEEIREMKQMIREMAGEKTPKVKD